MKIRNGFVSNSSSSSFIVSENGYFSTVKDVATYIINLTSEWYSYEDELKTLKSMNNPDTPVHFNTGGDYTYIRKIEDKIVIVTTQNIEFDRIVDNCLDNSEISDEFFKQFDYIDDYGDLMEHNDVFDLVTFYVKYDDFLILKYNFLGKHTYISNCKKCGRFNTGWVLKGGENVCSCQINKIIRKEKIKKINKI